MPVSGYAYSLLLVSASKALNDLIPSVLPTAPDGAKPLTMARCVSEARRTLAERPYDLVLVNAPLPDGFGTRLAVDVCMNSDAGAALLVPRDMYDEIYEKVLPSGLIVIAKPVSVSGMSQSLRVLLSVRERLRRQEEKRLSVEEKIEEIRIVNRAKWLLIERLGMKEAEAHRYIEKRAMDQRVSRRKVAESVLQTYK